MSRIAIFGGTFDPVHSAHLTVAREAADRFSLDKVLFVVAAHPPHKPQSTGAGFEHRIRMIELACETDARFEASRLEEGAGKSYSIDTIEELREQIGPGDRLFFLIGADAFAEISTWYRWTDVIAGVEFIVVTRPGHSYGVPKGALVHRLETVALPVSSSEARVRLASGAEVVELPEPVRAYILAQNLYR